MATYTTYGDVRGCCGHRHQTVESAERCLTRDQRGCERQRGYSDRVVAEIRDGRLYRVGGSDDDWIAGPGGRTTGAARFR